MGNISDAGAVEPSVTPAELQVLKPYEIEDLLCIYEEYLKEGELATNDLARTRRCLRPVR